MTSPPHPLFACVATGKALTRYLVDADTGALTPAGAITLPTRVQYAWPHATLPVLYTACADRGGDGDTHPFQLCAIWLGQSGELSLHGEPVALPARALHTTTDNGSRHALTIYGEEPGLTVHRLNDDGSIGGEIPRAADFRFGEKPHQIRMMPDDTRTILVSRGAKGFGTSKYVSGALQIIGFDGGSICNIADVTPPEAAVPNGFNPRDIDFHPDGSQILAVLEAQNELAVFDIEDGLIDPVPTFLGSILANPGTVHKRQDGGPVHIHPNGRFAYVGNRNDGYAGGTSGPSWLTPDPVPEFAGGENSIAVFALDTADGQPRLVQHADTGGFHARTFAIDASGTILIAGNIAPATVRDGYTRTLVPAGLSVFRIGRDGLLTLLHNHALTADREKLMWVGIVG